MYRYVHSTGQMQREIGDDPFVAILGDLCHADARDHASGAKIRGEGEHVIGHLLPRAPVQFTLANIAERLDISALLDGVRKVFPDRRRTSFIHFNMIADHLIPCKHQLKTHWSKGAAEITPAFSAAFASS